MEKIDDKANVMFTHEGRVMTPQILERILTVMQCPDTRHMSQKALALEIGIDRKTLRAYLTAQVREEIQALRKKAVEAPDMVSLDRAIYGRALRGDMAAAKLMYARWDKGVNVGGDVTDEDLASLRAEIEALEEGKD